MYKRVRPYFKYCLVPCCTNTTITAPHKLFLSVPKTKSKRDAWTRAMRRDSKRNPALSNNTSHWCCEDHFSLPDDLENYWRWKLTGNVQRLVLRDGVLPHIFECQEKYLPSLSTARKKVKYKVCELHFEPDQVVREASGYDPKTGRTLTAPLRIPRLRKGAVPTLFMPPPGILSKTTAGAKQPTKIKGKEESDESQLARLLQVDLGPDFQTAAETSVVIKQEPDESFSPELIIGTVLDGTELLPSYSSSSTINAPSIPANSLSTANPEFTNSGETLATHVSNKLVLTKEINDSDKDGNDSTSDATQATLRQLKKPSKRKTKPKLHLPARAKKSVRSSTLQAKDGDNATREIFQSVLVPETSVVIKQEPDEFVDEPPQFVIKNVIGAKESSSSSSSSSVPDDALFSANSEFNNVDENLLTRVSNKHAPKRKLDDSVPVVNTPVPGVTKAKLSRPTKPSKRNTKRNSSTGTSKKSAGLTLPTKDDEKETRELFQSLLDGNRSEGNPSFGSRSTERSGDLFNVFSDFIAEKLREMDWDDCAYALRAILEIVFNVGKVQHDGERKSENSSPSTSSESSGQH